MYDEQMHIYISIGSRFSGGIKQLEPVDSSNHIIMDYSIHDAIEACGLRHLAFCVDSVEQTVRELAEVGIECESIRVDDYTGKKMTFFHDPDGLPLELHE